MQGRVFWQRPCMVGELIFWHQSFIPYLLGFLALVIS